MGNKFHNTKQADLFGCENLPKCKDPDLRRITGDAFEHTVRAHLAAKCGVRTAQSPELSRSDIIAAVPICITIGGDDIRLTKHLSIQARGQETNSGTFNFYGYKPYEVDICAAGSLRGTAFFGGVPSSSSLSLSNSSLLNPDFAKMSWESAVNTHLQMWIDMIRHPEFEGVKYVPII